MRSIIIALIFILAGVLFTHGLTSINADIGRHIKLGEIIWQTGDVLETNLLSYTNPDYPFINHHWLSEVIFYGIYSLGADWLSGLKAIIIFKIAVLLAVYLLLFLIVRKHNIVSVVLGFIISIFVFSARTEPRPEIFSYLIFAVYLLILKGFPEVPEARLLEKVQKSGFWKLWLLPILQVLWVNLHIYFIIGPIIYLFFLIDKFANSKLKISDFIQNSKFEIKILTLIILANLANPNFINGALYPLNVLNSYGYSVAENSSLLFLARYFGRWAPQDKLFLVSVFILAGSLVLSFWNRKNNVPTPQVGSSRLAVSARERVLDLLLISMTAVLSFKMQRNIPLYALALWPIMAKNLNDFSNFEFRISNFGKLKKWSCACASILLIISAYLVVSGRFYNWLDSAKMFGLGVSGAAQDGVEFIKTNGIQGPVFNNFDIGSYLIWQLYPNQRVFIDGRPEAYPVEFFEKIYKPMQRDEKIWLEMSKKYGIDYVFFVHTDMTEWADEFLTRIGKDKNWPMVFINDAVVIFLKNTDANQPIINKHKITEDNVAEKIDQVLKKVNKKDGNAFINFGNALYRFRWLEASAKVFEALIENQPDDPYGYQGAGYAYATMNDPKTQKKAAENLERAINLGFETFNNYFTLGIIKANLGNFIAAEENLKKALKINPKSENARQALEAVKRKQYLDF